MECFRKFRSLVVTFVKSRSAMDHSRLAMRSQQVTMNAYGCLPRTVLNFSFRYYSHLTVDLTSLGLLLQNYAFFRICSAVTSQLTIGLTTANRGATIVHSRLTETGLQIAVSLGGFPIMQKLYLLTFGPGKPI